MKAKDNIHITDSYKVPKTAFYDILKARMRDVSADSPLRRRSIRSMVYEWALHNLLYSLHLFRDRTRDVDIDAPQPVVLRIVYNIFGFFAYFLIK